MKIITTQQMIELEEICLKDFSINRLTLMENAGRGTAKWINDFVSGRRMLKDIVIVCGGGNNGGDGFVSARVLYEMGFCVSVIILAKESDLKGPAKVNYSRIKKIKKISIHKIYNESQLEKIDSVFQNTGLVLDCILGTGMKGEVKGFIKHVIEYINNLGKTVIAVDIPSGMDGNICTENCIKSYATLTMGLPKIGLLKPGSEDSVGYLYVIDIGIPNDALKNVKSNIEYIYSTDFEGLLPKRMVSSHKGNFGHVLVLAGSPQYTGAAELCVNGALRAGAGLVTLGIPKSLRSIYQTKFTEAMTLGLPETLEGTLSQDAYTHIMKFAEEVNCIALGPGLSKNPETIKLLKKIISTSKKPLVIDADGINAIAEEMMVLRKAKAPLVLTPHPGEMAKLLHTSVKSVQTDRWRITQELAEKYGITIVLKGFHSIIACGDEKIFINSSGNPGMASGGMGDVLTGLISGLLAQGMSTVNSTKLGVYIHGAAGDIAVQEKCGCGIIASDLVEKIPYVMSSIYGK